MQEIQIGQVWVEKTTKTPVCIVSINPTARAVFIAGLPTGHQIVTFSDLLKNCQLLQDWGRRSALV